VDAAAAADMSETLPGIHEAGRDPACEHVTIAPAPQVGDEAADEAVRLSIAFVPRSVR